MLSFPAGRVGTAVSTSRCLASAHEPSAKVADPRCDAVAEGDQDHHVQRTRCRGSRAGRALDSDSQDRTRSGANQLLAWFYQILRVAFSPNPRSAENSPHRGLITNDGSAKNLQKETK
jgi:hypothetical protein